MIEISVCTSVPPSDDPCHLSCLTLSQLSVNCTHILNQNTTLVLQPGSHILPISLSVRDVSFFKLVSEPSGYAHIRCEISSSFTFQNIERLHLMGLKFVRCGENQFVNINEFVLFNVTFNGDQSSGTALELIGTNAQITSCNFLSNTNGSLRSLEKQFVSIKAIFGAQGLQIDSNETWIGSVIIANESNISISSSTFKTNEACVGGVLFVQNSIITVNNSTFSENSIRDLMPQSLSIGGVMYQENSFVNITNCLFFNNSALIGGSIFALQGTLRVYNSCFTLDSASFGGSIFSSFVDVYLQGRFVGSVADYGGAVRLFFSRADLVSSQFISNSATFGGAILSFTSIINI